LHLLVDVPEIGHGAGEVVEACGRDLMNSQPALHDVVAPSKEHISTCRKAPHPAWNGGAHAALFNLPGQSERHLNLAAGALEQHHPGARLLRYRALEVADRVAVDGTSQGNDVLRVGVDDEVTDLLRGEG